MNLQFHNEYRFITIIGTLQIVAVLLGCFLSTAAVKVLGYRFLSSAELPMGPLFMRDHGWTMLSVPLAWVVFGFLSKRRDSPFWEGPFALLLGYGLLAALTFFCIGSAVAMFMTPI